MKNKDNKMKKAYCENCDKRQEYIPIYQNIIENIRGVKIEYEGVKTYCRICGEEVYVGKYDDVNTEIVHKLYMKKLNNSK